MRLRDLQREAYRIAVARRQWITQVEQPFGGGRVNRHDLEEAYKHLAGEVVEAATAHWGLSTEQEADELADVVICAGSIAEALGIDLEAAVRRSLLKNERRAREGQRE